MLALTAGYSLSGWAVAGSLGVAGQHDAAAVVVSTLWALAVVVRAVRPRAAVFAVGLAWLVTIALGIAIAATGRSTLEGGGPIHGFPDALSFQAVAGLVALIAVAAVERGDGQWATRPGWTHLLWTLPVAALLVGLAVRVRTGSTRWLWAAALLLSGRRLVLANSGWVAAVPAFAGSALWITLLVGPAGAPPAVAGLVGGLVFALLAVRTARRRSRRALAQPLVP